MKSIMMKCLIVFIGLGITGIIPSISAYSEAVLPKVDKDGHYPITYFDSLNEAVKEYQNLTFSNPVLIPKWLPSESYLESIRILGGGDVLTTEYVGGDLKVRIHVNPKIERSDLSKRRTITINDTTKAEYKENNFLYSLNFDEEGRNYMILIEKKNVKSINNVNPISVISKDKAIEYMVKIGQSLTPFKGDSYFKKRTVNH
ncbi:hypothetical protein [Paenibacillus illinoisensis]|uniref:Uncharacterized protein n=1 Tax=Paenibacillus illinoisensis TaxID=59845 RepID=A0A2W0CBZ7_9BACL|nr:hypothetical protein [Paenibacillus illinoisensis]PYY25855.1 hypothetical protein PIL02S_05224 [Paenibacillus illinoisensis]